MQYPVTKQIGNKKYTFIIEGDGLFECLMEAKKLSFYDVPSCGNCNSDNLYLTAYQTEGEGFKYIKMMCGKCKWSVTFGQPKGKGNENTWYMRKNDSGQLDWQKPFMDQAKGQATSHETARHVDNVRHANFGSPPPPPNMPYNDVPPPTDDGSGLPF